MNADLFRTFLAAVDAGSFTAAASELFVSQATVSCRIQSLEAELGVQLFERTARGIVLTEAGRALVAPARALIESEKAVREAIPDRPKQRVVRLGSSPGSSSYVTPYLISLVHNVLPDVRLKVDVDEVPSLLERVAADDVDIALVEPCRLRKGVRPHWLANDRVVIAAAADSAFAQIPRPIPVPVAAQLPFVQRHRQCCTLEFISKRLRTASDGAVKSPNVTMWMKELDLLKNLVRAGGHVTAISEWALVEELASGEFITLDVEGLELVRQRAAAVADREDLSPEVGEVLGVFCSPESLEKLGAIDRFRWWLNVERVGGACSLDQYVRSTGDMSAP